MGREVGSGNGREGELGRMAGGGKGRRNVNGEGSEKWKGM